MKYDITARDLKFYNSTTMSGAKLLARIGAAGLDREFNSGSDLSV